MTLDQYKIIKQQLRARIGLAKTYTFLKQAYLDLRIIIRDVYNAREKVNVTARMECYSIKVEGSSVDCTNRRY
jgi:hypothetical protein